MKVKKPDQMRPSKDAMETRTNRTDLAKTSGIDPTDGLFPFVIEAHTHTFVF